MKKTLLIAGLASITLFACKKDDDNNNTTTTTPDDFKTTEQKSLNDFVDIVAVPQYTDLAAKATALNNTVIALDANPTANNLDNARTAWTDLRSTWEQCEGFLFGPVEDDNYDPSMDTWPTDYHEMDSLLASTASLNQGSLDNITLSLRGFHPLEYILFGDHGAQKAEDLTPRQREYMKSLAADLQANCQNLAGSWSPSSGNYASTVKTAGYGSSKYATRREVYLAMADGLVAICEEVGTGKMQDPLGQNASQANPQLVESPYSGNSTTDFKNNIIGLQNVYLAHYGTKSGKSLSDLVAFNNQALDNKIKTQISAAISSFAAITLPYEQAITQQRTQIQNTQAALATLQATLESDLHDYINQYVKD